MAARKKKPITRNALVTGAGRRVGREIALTLARTGWNVALHCHRSRKAATALAAEIEALGRKAVVLPADLAEESAATRLVKDAAKALGGLELLVCNASVFEKDSLATLPRAAWDAHMQLHMRSPALLSQAFAAQLPKAAEGNIVMIADATLFWSLSPVFFSYTLSKLGMLNLTRLLALELAPRIRVNAIGPGPTLESKHDDPRTFKKICDSLPLKRASTPEDICRALHFILETPSYTGQVIALSGGVHLLESM